MGLLDSMGAPQAPGQAAPTGGLLGAAPPQGGAVDPAMKAQWLQMAQALAANPTPEIVQQLIQQLQQMGDEGSQKFAQILSQGLQNPDAIPALAQMIVQKLSGQ